MDRRFVGCVLMTLILVAVISMPGILGRNLSGDAYPAVHVNPALSAGQCLAPLNTPDELNSIIDLVPVVSCSQPHSAEVLSIGRVDAKLWPKRPTIQDTTFVSGDLSVQCDRLAAQFLGWGIKNPLSRIQVSFYTRLTVPGPLEWRLGQRWYSCELMPGLLNYPISYNGTAQDASFRTPPGPFANCSDGPGELSISCDQPHHAEVLARVYGKTPETSAGCAQLVGKIIGTTDPTFGGQLAVLARVQGAGSECWVTTTSSQSLTTTLINHGAAPLGLK